MLPVGRFGMRADLTAETQPDGRRMMTGGSEDAHPTAHIQSTRGSDQLTHGLDPTVILMPDGASSQQPCGVEHTAQMMLGGASGMVIGGFNSTAHNMADRELVTRGARVDPTAEMQSDGENRDSSRKGIVRRREKGQEDGEEMLWKGEELAITDKISWEMAELLM
ncbi:hypothetical protein DKX38_029677 [Salix brachista]|uniref:Uncharacterized protein n=1 Tax=Salix brachista TaxID=2182728 RepID=A0A5N5IZW2_9ROSI|nr:hypothetical protein DKX38_029677 [Salix brachista]